MAFVGREVELAALLGAVERAPTSGLVAALVAGEPGIGKSMLLDEAAARLADRGWRILTVRADPLERRIPYAALDAALRYFAPPPQDGFTEGLRRDALVALELTDAEPDSALTPAGTWFGLACAAMARLLTALAVARPVAVSIDDLHHLDDDSLALLSVALRRVVAAPIAVIATVRSHLLDSREPLADLMAQLGENADRAWIELEAFPAGDLAGILTPILGAPVGPGLLADVHRRADGNPLFAVEIARSLIEQNQIVAQDGTARLTGAPEAVRLSRHDVILRRAAPLTPDTRAVAGAVAVFRRIRLDQTALLARVAGRSEAEVIVAFDELVRSGLLVREAGYRYRFAHDLVADALYEQIGPAERRLLHRLIAEALSADRAAGLEVDVLELAWHVSESAQPGDSAALDLLTEAANRTRVSAPERSASLCARAIELATDDRRSALLALRCRALFRASRPAAAAEAGQAALALLPSGAERARTAITVVSSLHLTSRLAEAIELADAEIRAGAAPAALHAQRAMLLAFSRRTDEAAAEAELTESLPTASPVEAVIVTGHLAMVWSLLARHDRTVSYVDRAVAAAARSPVLELQALAVGASAEALAALVPQATAHLQRAAAIGCGHAFRAEILVSRIALDWLGGRWGAALEGLPGAAAELHAGQHRSLVDALTAIELDIRSWRGELGVAQRLVERPASPLPNMANMRAVALVGYQLARGEIDAARGTIDAAVYGEGWQGPSAPPYSCVLLGQRVEIELDHGSPDVAAEVLATLVEVATGRFAPWSISTLHRTRGRVNGDVEELRHAVAAARAGGLVLEEARAQLALGELDPCALDELVAAYLAFQALGADTLRRRAGRRLRELGGKVPRVRSRSRGLLTEAEEKIARLVQQGMRNREIAVALNYSPRSVEVYLSRIYAKLRISSRLELARTLDARHSEDR